MNVTTLAATLWWVDDCWGSGKDGPFCFEDYDLEYVVQDFLERASRRERRRWRQVAKLLKAQYRPSVDVAAARAEENMVALRGAVGREVLGVEHMPPYRGTFVLTFVGDDARVEVLGSDRRPRRTVPVVDQNAVDNVLYDPLLGRELQSVVRSRPRKSVG